MSRKRSGVNGLFGFLLGAVLIISGCGGGGGGSSSDSSTNQPVEPTTFSPTLGSWSGDNVSFTLVSGSLLVTNLSVKYSGQYQNCRGGTVTYNAEVTFDSNIQVIDNTFTFEAADFPGSTSTKMKITGIFTSATTAEIDISWSEYDDECRTWHEGSATYYASPGSASSYSIVNPYIQYRAFEDSSSNSYRVWFEFKKEGAPIAQADLVEFLLMDAAGNEVIPSDSGFVRYKNMLYDCSTAPCTTSGPFETSGVWGTFANLAAGNYNFEANMANGEQATGTVNYPGQLILPTVASATLKSRNINGDLELSWVNPTTDPNWKEVDELRIIVFDGNGSDVLYIKAYPANSIVTIPASLVSQAAALGSGSLARWEVQTRAYDVNSMNFARGVSNRVEISTFAIPNAYMQYRNYPNTANNTYAAWIEVTKDGQAVQSTDVNGFKITDPVGNEVTPTSSSFAQGNYFYYDCSTTPCTLSPQPIKESGYVAKFSNAPAGNYRYEVTASDGRKFTRDLFYPGMLVLPIVPTNTMSWTTLANGDARLNWINPTGAANWSEVDQLRIILMAGDAAYTELVYVRVNPSNQTVIIPASLISQAESLGKGPVKYWTIQTRAYDANNMMYARGYSF